MQNITRRNFARLAAAGAATIAGTGLLGGNALAFADEAEVNTELSGTVVFSTWGSDAEIETDRQVIEAFNKQYPNVTVDLEVYNDAFLTKVETMMAAGTAPDVIYGHPKYFMKWASEDLICDLTEQFNATEEFWDEDVYATNIYDAFTYDGKMVATVNGADTFLLFYNMDLFDEAGVDYPTDDWTWDDFTAACEKLTQDKDGDGYTDQYAITTGKGHEQIEAYMAAFGGQLYNDVNDPTEVMVNTEKNKQALQFWYDQIFTNGYAPDDAGSEIVTGGFDGGQIAMDLDGVYQCVYRSGVDFRLGLAHLPMQDENSHYVSLMAGYCIPKTTQNFDAAWALASFMQKAAGQRVLASTGLITTVNMEVAASDEVIGMEGAPENHVLRVTSLEGAVNVDTKLPNWQETLDSVWSPAIDALYAGNASVDETLETLQSGLEQKLEEAKQA